MSIESMRELSDFCSISAIFSAGAAAVLFFVLDIRKAWGDITGRRARREVKRIRSRSLSLPGGPGFTDGIDQDAVRERSASSHIPEGIERENSREECTVVLRKVDLDE